MRNLSLRSLLLMLPLLASPGLRADDLESESGATVGGKAAVVIKVPPTGLFREAALEVRFPDAMVADATVGQSVDASTVLAVTPALKGSFTWRSRYNGTFKPVEMPPLGAKYSISLAAGLKTPAGTAPLLPSPVVAPAPTFGVVRTWPEWFSEGQRQPVLVYYFNDAVDVASATPKMFFRDKTGQKLVPAAVTLATGKDLSYNPPALGYYADQFAGGAKFNKEEAVPSALRITPSQPLPPGEGWKFVVDAGIANVAKSTTTTGTWNSVIGTITPIKLSAINADSPLDAERNLEISFTKQLPKTIPLGTLKRLITVAPLPEEAKWAVAGNSITITGDFEINTPYKVAVLPGIISNDGLKTTEATEKTVTFQPHEAGVALASYGNTQWLGGKRQFGIDSANNAKVAVQIKRIDPINIVYALRGYDAYEHDTANSGGYTRIPYGAMAGKTVWQKDFKSAVDLDTSEHFEFTWDEALGGQKAGVYFVSVEGHPKRELSTGSIVGSQSLIQLTDIGLAWKFNGKQALVFAFSHTSGQPLKEIQLATFDDDSNPLTTVQTDANGLATIAMSPTAKWLVAVGNQDWHGIAFHESMPHLGMWDFDVNYAGRGDEEEDGDTTRDTLFFTDRPVYQPGEEVFLKVITRQHLPEGLSIHPNKTARLRAFDLNQQIFLDKKITFSETGTFADLVKLPANGVGSYHFEIDFFKSDEQLKKDAERRAKEKEENGEEEGEEESATADADAEGEEGEEEVADSESDKIESTTSHYIIVQEYQPNAFKISFNEAAMKLDGETLNTPVKAAYFMGKALSDATLKWTSTINQERFEAEKFSEYEFCHAKSYRVYDGEQWKQIDREAWHSPLVTGQGELKLSAKGESVIPAGLPASFGVPGPKVLTIDSEITDINQQTIAGNLLHTIHASQFYIGVKQGRNAYYANTDIPVEMVAVTTDGKRYSKPVAAKMLVERLVWNAVKVETAGGGTDIRHDVTMERVSESDINISPEVAKELVSTLKLEKPGTYNVTVTAADPEGKVVKTIVSLDVYGRDPQEGAWTQNEGVKIELTPDKDLYKAGDVAKVIVKSPFKGLALITVEREKVLKSWLAQVDGKGGAVDVPIDDSFAPNCFVTVMQIRGGFDDPREFKQPDYKFGIAELTVESHANDLSVEITSAQPEVRPGAQVSLTCKVKDAAGKAVPNAEIALWAADDGILSLVNYQMPDVVGTFHYAQKLRVTTGVSLDGILAENPEERDYANKGFVVGGGGDEGDTGTALRKEFKALAYWNPGLKTGADGTVTISFAAPDNLTQFKVQAIVNEGVSRFGKGESEFKINKPLMLEPAMPRFANVGDEIMLKAVVHNTTQTAGEIELTLNIDDHLQIVTAEKETSAGKTLSVGAGQSKATYFPVRFTKMGTATFKWSAVAKNGPKELADAVQTTLEIGTTEPMLRDVRYLNVGEKAAGKNLLETLSPELLDSPATIKLVVSNNRLVEGSGAIEQLLHYPYGCAEQTTSAMLPWLAVKDLKKALPSLNKSDAEIAKVIQKSVDRLLSMQTRSGGLAYWPKGESPLLWASAQGGMGLVLASQAGANVPPARLASLLRYLSKSLRSEADEGSSFDELSKCFACYALALAGKAEPAYHDVLFQKRDELSTSARAMLALAVAESKGDPEMVATLLGKAKDEGKQWNWLGTDSERAIRVLAWLKLNNQVKADAAMEVVMNNRSPRGDWKNTFNNGWVVLALAEHSKAQIPWDATQPATLTFNGKDQTVAFGAEASSQSITFTTLGGGALPTLQIKVPGGRRLYANVEISARAKKNLDQGRASGFAIARSYQKVDALGVPQNGEAMKVGDLVLVSLNVDVPGDSEYLVIDDPLPASLEGVNPEFATMANNARAGQQPMARWTYDHEEMRRDRVLYFRDQFVGSGRFTLQYLARVVAEGKVTAPAARIEAMYDPAKFGLCPAEKLTTVAGDDSEVAGR